MVTKEALRGAGASLDNLNLKAKENKTMTELTYKEREELAEEIGKIVRKYFTDLGHGYCKPYVSFSQYDIRHYTFGISCQTLGASATYVLRYEKEYELTTFRKEVRDLLKQHGFKSIKFDIKNLKYRYDWGGTYQTDIKKELIGIYFDWEK